MHCIAFNALFSMHCFQCTAFHALLSMALKAPRRLAAEDLCSTHRCNTDTTWAGRGPNQGARPIHDALVLQPVQLAGCWLLDGNSAQMTGCNPQPATSQHDNAGHKHRGLSVRPARCQPLPERVSLRTHRHPPTTTPNTIPPDLMRAPTY